MTTQELDELQALCDGDKPTSATVIVMITALPALIAEVRRLTARCEAAERDISQVCDTCKHDLEDDETSAEICGACGLETKWEWRGPHPAKEDTNA